MNIQENINVLFEKFEAFINSQTIVGQEIKVGDVTIIPLASISFGLGAGAGGDSASDSNGGGSGICAKATPQALLVVNGSDVNLIPIRKGSSFETLLDSVPALIDKIKEMKPETEDSEDE